MYIAFCTLANRNLFIFANSHRKPCEKVFWLPENLHSGNSSGARPPRWGPNYEDSRRLAACKASTQLGMALCDSATNASIPRRSQPCQYDLAAVSAQEAEERYHADKSLASPLCDSRAVTLQTSALVEPPCC